MTPAGVEQASFVELTLGQPLLDHDVNLTHGRGTPRMIAPGGPRHDGLVPGQPLRQAGDERRRDARHIGSDHGESAGTDCLSPDQQQARVAAAEATCTCAAPNRHARHRRGILPGGTVSAPFSGQVHGR